MFSLFFSRMMTTRVRANGNEKIYSIRIFICCVFFCCSKGMYKAQKRRVNRMTISSDVVDGGKIIFIKKNWMMSRINCMSNKLFILKKDHEFENIYRENIKHKTKIRERRFVLSVVGKCEGISLAILIPVEKKNRHSSTHKNHLFVICFSFFLYNILSFSHL